MYRFATNVGARSPAARPMDGSFFRARREGPNRPPVFAPSSGEESAPRGLRNRRSARGDAQLRKDVRHVTMDRVLADKELFGNVLIVEAAGDQAQHFDLAPGEPGAMGGGVARGPGSSRWCEGVQKRAGPRDLQLGVKLRQQIDRPPGLLRRGIDSAERG